MFWPLVSDHRLPTTDHVLTLLPSEVLQLWSSDFRLPSSEALWLCPLALCGSGICHVALPYSEVSIILDSRSMKARKIVNTHNPIMTSRKGVMDPDSVRNMSMPKIKMIPEIWPESINTPWDVASGAG